MPTVNSIARSHSTTNNSSRILRTNLERTNAAIANNVNSAKRRPNVSEMLGNYAQERENFNAEFDATMASLRESADRFKDNVYKDDGGALSTLGDFATFKIPPEETDHIREFQEFQRDTGEADLAQTAQRITHPVENVGDFAEEYLVAEKTDSQSPAEIIQNLNATREENLDAALSNVRDFVNTFNSAVDYFNENRGVSDRMNALASSFGNNENLTSSLNAVGISINENGRLRVDENRLADALNENSSNVDAALGQNGLAGQLDRTVNLANSQRENLFPSITDYAGAGSEPTNSLYTAQNDKTAALSKEDAGKILNMFT